LPGEGLVEEFPLQPTEIDVISADIGCHIHFRPAKSGLVIRFDDRDASIVDQLDPRDDPVAGRGQDYEIVFLSDEILQIRQLSRDIPALPSTRS
jgi:hypothetical protein